MNSKARLILFEQTLDWILYYPRKMRGLGPQVGLPPKEHIIWTGVTNLNITWAGGNGMLKQNQAVRKNTPQKIMYSFTDENGAALDLTGYSVITFEAKQQGATYVSQGAVFDDITTGVVRLDAYTFEAAGIWTIQFFVGDSGGNKIFGEPLQILVAGNVEDLTTNQLIRA